MTATATIQIHATIEIDDEGKPTALVVYPGFDTDFLIDFTLSSDPDTVYYADGGGLVDGEYEPSLALTDEVADIYANLVKADSAKVPVVVSLRGYPDATAQVRSS